MRKIREVPPTDEGKWQALKENSDKTIAFKKNPSLVRAPSALKTILFLNCFEGAWRPNLLQTFS